MSELICEFGFGPNDYYPRHWTEPEFEVVWLTEERTYAYLLQQGAHTSRVRYLTPDGLVEEDIENDEFEPWRERAIDYESE